MINETSDKIAFETKFRWADKSPVYEVPLIKNIHGDITRVKIPISLKLSVTYFYSPQCDRVAIAVAVDGAADKYLRARKYARFIGFAKYHPQGIGHYEWKPQD